jgi:hypothetical protein
MGVAHFKVPGTNRDSLESAGWSIEARKPTFSARIEKPNVAYDSH